jgi:hypothetical protein
MTPSFHPPPPSADTLSPSYYSRWGNRSSSNGSSDSSHITTINRIAGLLLPLPLLLLLVLTLWVCGRVLSPGRWCTLILKVYYSSQSIQPSFPPSSHSKAQSSRFCRCLRRLRKKSTVMSFSFSPHSIYLSIYLRLTKIC